MSISSEITSMGENLKKDYQSIANLGADLTNVDKNIENIAELLDGVYDVLPKTSFQEGTEITLSNTLKGKLDFDNGVVGIGQSSQKILPSEYQEVEYIESTGTQFLMTNTYINNNNISIKTKVTTPNMPSMEQDIIGNQDNTTGRFVLGLYNNVVFGFSRNNAGADANVISTSYSGEQTLEIELDYNYSSSKKTLKVNDTSYDMAYTQSISNSNNAVQIFGNGNGENRLVGKVYYLKLYKGDTLSIDLYPCYRISDNVIGMYDLVTGTFYTNQGTGTFTKGANAPTPNAKIPISCVTGNQDVVVKDGNNNTIATYQLSLGDRKVFEDDYFWRDNNGKFYHHHAYQYELFKNGTINRMQTTVSGKYRFSIEFSKLAKAVLNNDVVADIYSNILIKNSGNQIYQAKNGIGINMSGAIHFYYDSFSAYTIEEMTSYFSNKNDYIVYPLAEETDEEITGTLAEQLEAWWNAHSLNGTTIITSNGNLPMIIKVRGLKGES